MKKGFTLIELLVATAIISLMIIAILVAMRLQLSRSRDAQRKSDLEKIKIAFEDYYNDNGCYPAATVLEDCGAASFSPYLSKIPCDPMNKQPYVYLPLANACRGYRVYAALEDSNDPVIKKMGCNTTCGCGYGSSYNYGVSAGTEIISQVCPPLTGPVASTSPPGGSPTPGSPSPAGSPGPSPSPIYAYACSHEGVCNVYDINNVPSRCPYSFPSEAECDASCSDLTKRCTN